MVRSDQLFYILFFVIDKLRRKYQKKLIIQSEISELHIIKLNKYLLYSKIESIKIFYFNMILSRIELNKGRLFHTSIQGSQTRISHHNNFPLLVELTLIPVVFAQMNKEEKQRCIIVAIGIFLSQVVLIINGLVVANFPRLIPHAKKNVLCLSGFLMLENYFQVMMCYTKLLVVLVIQCIFFDEYILYMTISS